MEATLINMLGVEGYDHLMIWMSNNPHVPMLIVAAIMTIAAIIIVLVFAIVHDIIVSIINFVNARKDRKLFRFSEDY